MNVKTQAFGMMPAFLHSLFSVTISYLSCMCTAFAFAGTNSQRQGWVRGASEQPFAQGRFSISSAGLSACSGNLLIFLSGCAAYRLLFKQTRALRSNSVFKAIALLARLVQRMVRCTNENLPKVCRNKRTNLHFDFGR